MVSVVDLTTDQSARFPPASATAMFIGWPISFAFFSQLQSKVFSFDDFDRFQRNLVQGRPNDWHCRAGARFLYVCEDGLVHYCSQQRGYPAIPLVEYTFADIEREYRQRKSCEPWCTISCVPPNRHARSGARTPTRMLEQLIARRHDRDPSFRTPLLLRALEWAFLTDPGRRE